MKTRLSYLLAALLLILLGYALNGIAPFASAWSGDISLFIIISLSGAFGGLLYTSRDSGFEFPHKDPDEPHIWRLGWIADCAYGIAGGYVVFLIVPTDLGEAANVDSAHDVVDFVKFVALALVGGYGGRSLVDRALANIVKDVEEAKQDAREAKEQLSLTQETDTRARALVSQHLDPNSDIQDLDQLKESVKAASLAARFEIFKEARSVRKDNWEKNKPLMERTIPVFEALIDNTAGEHFHRTHAQLGYALKDKAPSDWPLAFDQLTTAIELRDKQGIKGFLMYEYNRALCGIHIGRSPDTVRADIDTAVQRDSLRELFTQDPTFNQWAADNNFTL